jgi:hypothetical protein
MSSWNPIRRSPIKPKAKQHRESAPWRRKKIRLDGREMAELRQNAFARSQGYCENSVKGLRCSARIFWMTGQLAHLTSRGQGGSDEMKNVLFVCEKCHVEDTLNRRKLEPHRDWLPNGI